VSHVTVLRAIYTSIFNELCIAFSICTCQIWMRHCLMRFACVFVDAALFVDDILHLLHSYDMVPTEYWKRKCNLWN
jgi:hypothetical protein